MSAGAGVPSAAEMELQKMNFAGVGRVLDRESWMRFCRPWREWMKEGRPSWKFTGQAQWMMSVVDEMRLM